MANDSEVVTILRSTCKTTRLVRKIVQVAYENQLKLLEFDRVLLAVRVEKICQEL